MPQAMTAAQYDIAAFWAWIALAPAMVSGHFAAKEASAHGGGAVLYVVGFSFLVFEERLNELLRSKPLPSLVTPQVLVAPGLFPEFDCCRRGGASRNACTALSAVLVGCGQLSYNSARS
jgi:hypothetical protein